jgi:integrase
MHRVPLSKPVLALLKELKTKADAHLAKHPDSKRALYVLRNARGKHQQADAADLFGIENFVGHDLRRTAASLMTGSCRVQRLTVSKILNHVESGVTAIYDRHSYDAEKRAALDKWGRQLTTIIEQREVVAFAARG